MNRLFLFLYEAVLWGLAFVFFPFFIYAYVFKKKYRKSFFSRLGINFPIKEKLPNRSIWIHAVSLGETKAVASLARALKLRFPDRPLIISTTTETGHAEGLRSLCFADYHVYLPFDFRGIIKKVIHLASPSLVILCESDFWFNFLEIAKEQGAFVALVNGKISETSTKRLKSVPFFSKRLFSLVDCFSLQNILYKDRFEEIGVSSEKLFITGNLKFDDEYARLNEQEIVNWREKFGIHKGDSVLTIGSTHYPEEEHFLKIVESLFEKHPKLRVMIVPRHPERFEEVMNLLEKKQVNAIRFTNINQRTGEEQVILIDAMGLLRLCYQLSNIAVVGGSFFDGSGGHNIIEPCWYGVPVVFGPFMKSQKELVELVSNAEAGLQTTITLVEGVLGDLLSHTQKRKEMGMKGSNLVSSLIGSVDATLKVLEPILKKISL